MFSPALRRHARHGAFDDLEQRLLHAFTGNIPGDRRIVRLARNFVDLIYIDDSALGFFNIVIGRLEQD